MSSNSMPSFASVGSVISTTVTAGWSIALGGFNLRSPLRIPDGGPAEAEPIAKPERFPA